MDGSMLRAKRTRKWMQFILLGALGCWLVGFTSRVDWPGLGRPFSDRPFSDSLVPKFQNLHFPGFGDEDEQPPHQPPEMWASVLRTAPGHQGEALLFFLASSAMLVRGGWFLTDSPRACQVASWFAVGALISACCLDAATEHVGVQTLVAVACQGGTFFALFPEAAAYIIGALASVVAQRIVQRAVTLHVPNEAQSGPSHVDPCWWQLSAGLLGGCLCLHFPKPALDILATSAGSAGLAVVVHWLPSKDATPISHGSCLLSSDPEEACGTVARWVFALLWACFFVAGSRIQLKRAELSPKQKLNQLYQDALRKTLWDSDRLPAWPGQADKPALELPSTKVQSNSTETDTNENKIPSPKSLEEGRAPPCSTVATFRTFRSAARSFEELDIYLPEGVEAPVFRQELDMYIPKGMKPPVFHPSGTLLPALQPVHEAQIRRTRSDVIPVYRASSSTGSPVTRPSSAASGKPDGTLRRFQLGSSERPSRSISAAALSSEEASAILGLPPKSAFRRTLD